MDNNWRKHDENRNICTKQNVFETLNESTFRVYDFPYTEYWTVCFYFSTLMVVTILIRKYLWRPMYKYYDWTDDGYEYPGYKSKMEVANEVQQRRKVGNFPPIYPNGWIRLLESSDLRPGQVKHVQALGENFAVFRSEAGEAYILDAYCPHLGANMAVGGKVKGDCLECPFHAWQFRGQDGHCSSIPYSDKLPKSSIVKKWTSCEENGVIFVWYHAEGDAPTWKIERINEICNGNLSFRGFSELLCRGHFQDVKENGADVSHFGKVHAPSRVELSSWKASCDPDKKHVFTTEGMGHINLFGRKICTVNIKTIQYGPTNSHVIFNVGFVRFETLITVTPLAPLLCNFVTRVYCHPVFSVFGIACFNFLNEMIRKDLPIWNHKIYVSQPTLVKEDEAILKHRRWSSQFYSDNSPRLTFHRESTDW